MWGILKKLLFRRNSANEEDSSQEIVLPDTLNSTSEAELMRESKGKQVEKKPVNDVVGKYRETVKKVKHPVVIIWHYLEQNEPHKVYVCGSWDGWDNHIKLHKTNNFFSTVINLEPGYYEFKFYVDNEWMTNENLPYTDVGYYSKNIMTVKGEDFELLSGAEKDNMVTDAHILLIGDSHNVRHGEVVNERFRTFEKYIPFSQEIPTREEFAAYSPPPLPPSLAKEFDDWPTCDELNLYPETETSSILLNHLYILEIYDDILVESSTSRLGKKFTTTVFYKPL